MSILIFGICSIVCFGALFLHELKGTPLMIPPLEASSLDGNVKALLKFSWHVGSILTVSMGVLFARVFCSPKFCHIQSCIVFNDKVMVSSRSDMNNDKSNYCIGAKLMNASY